MKIPLGVPASPPEHPDYTRTPAWLPADLPSIGDVALPRWRHLASWMGPDTRHLCRHVDGQGTRRVTTERLSPPGFVLERDLGVVHAHALRGTTRLLRTSDGFHTTTVEGPVADEIAPLGYLEQAPLPLLVPLELRRVRASGQLTLAAGSADPLLAHSDHVSTLGFLDGYPVEPTETRFEPVVRTISSLWRRPPSRRDERHAYGSRGQLPDDTVLGSVWRHAAPTTVPLVRRSDGRICTSLIDVPRATRPAPRTVARWAAAPVTWPAGRVPEGWALRASAGRVRDVVSRARRRSPVAEETLGHLRTEPGPCCSPIYSATHPVVDDQYLTRSPVEATDMGYVLNGRLGWLSDHHWDARRIETVHEVPWASRFGQHRRYEEPAPGT